MNRDEMMQRFYKVPGKVAYETDELVFDHASARLIFRETEKNARDRRVSNSQWIVCIGLSEIILLALPIPEFLWLLIPFAAIGFWGIRWSIKQQVFETNKDVYFEIDAQRQKICLPISSQRQEYRELDISQIRNFYMDIDSDNDTALTKFYLCCTYGKYDEKVVLREISLSFVRSSTFSKNADQFSYYARLLGILCDRDVLQRNAYGKLCPVKKDKAFP